MKKSIIFIIAIMLIAGVCFAEEVKLTYTISADNVDDIVTKYCAANPNRETKDDPNWINPEDGSFPPQVNKYTPKQWVREHIFRHIKQQVERGDGIIKRKAIVLDDVTGID